MGNTADQPKKKRKYKTKPTSRMVKTVAIMAEKGSSYGSAMREAGYSEAVALSPSKITRSEAFQALMEEVGVSDRRIAEVLRDGLGATKTVIIGQGDQAMADQVDDHTTRHRYLETALRLKGLGKSEGMTVTFNNMVLGQREEYKL